MATTNVERAREFLQHRRIAVVGVSRDAKDFSRTVLRELLRRGYDAVPVHPAAAEVEGRACFASVGLVEPRPDVALLLTPPRESERVAHECREAGVRRVWMHRGAGAGAASPAAVAVCEAAGIEVVTDLCPFMVLEGAGFPHRVHAFLRRVRGRRAAAAR